MTAEQRTAILGMDVHAHDVQKDFFVPAPAVEGGVRQVATAGSAFGQLTAKIAELEAAVKAVQEAQEKE